MICFLTLNCEAIKTLGASLKFPRGGMANPPEPPGFYRCHNISEIKKIVAKSLDGHVKLNKYLSPILHPDNFRKNKYFVKEFSWK